MLVEVGQKKATAQSAQSAQSDEPMHQGDKVHRTVSLHEKTALCDKSVWSSSERAAQRSITAAGRGAGREEARRGAEKLHNDRLHQTCGPVNQQRHV